MKKMLLAASLALPIATIAQTVPAQALSLSTPIKIKTTKSKVLTEDQPTHLYEITATKAGKLNVETLFKTPYMTFEILDEKNQSVYYHESDYTVNEKEPELDKDFVYLEKGKYTIKVSNRHGIKNNYEDYSYTFETSFKDAKTNEKEYNNSFNTANTITVNKTNIVGLLSKYDYIDFYKVNVSKRTDVNIRLSTPMSYTDVTLYDANYNQIIEQSSPQSMSETNYTETQFTNKLTAGTYYIKVEDTETGLYKLFVTAPGLLPAAPKVDTLKKGNTTVRGTAAKNSTIIVKINGKNYTGKSNAKGKFTVKVPKLKAKTAVMVYVKNTRGTSKGKKVTVK